MPNDAESLLQISREWCAAVAAGDREAVLAYWADDAVMMPPGQPVLNGKDAIRSFLDATDNIPGFAIRWEPINAHLSDDGNMGYLIERNVVTMHNDDGQPLETHGNVVTIWRKDENGVWKCVVDTWTETPAEG